MTVTVDINVLLDVFQQRQPHYAASAQVVSLVSEGKLTGVCPAHGLTTLYYLVRKHATKADAEAALADVFDTEVLRDDSRSSRVKRQKLSMSSIGGCPDDGQCDFSPQ